MLSSDNRALAGVLNLLQTILHVYDESLPQLHCYHSKGTSIQRANIGIWKNKGLDRGTQASGAQISPLTDRVIVCANDISIYIISIN